MKIAKPQKMQDGVTQIITMNGIHQMQWSMEPSVTTVNATKIGTATIITVTQMEITAHIAPTAGEKMEDIGVKNVTKITGQTITQKQEYTYMTNFTQTDMKNIGVQNVQADTQNGTKKKIAMNITHQEGVTT